MKSRDRAALGQELRVRDVADVRRARARRARARTFSPVPTGTVLFMTSSGRAGQSSGNSSTTVQTAERSASPDVRRRRADGDVEEVRAVDRLLHVERERDPLAIAREHVVEPRLVDRHLAVAQPLDALGEDVADDDVVAEVGEARAGDEADVAGSEDSYPRHGSRVIGRSMERLETLGDRDHRRVRQAVEDRVLHPVDGVARVERRSSGSRRRS